MNLKDILKSEFFKNVVTLLSGTTAGQVISILMVPVIARLYTPEQFGDFALFISIATVIAVISSARYELAIIPTKQDSNAFNLFIICIIFTLVSAFFSLIIILIFNNYIEFILNYIELCKWLYLLPLSILLLSFQIVAFSLPCSSQNDENRKVFVREHRHVTNALLRR